LKHDRRISQENAGEFKMKINCKKSEECAQYAERFMKAVVKAESPMELAELFYGNSYLKKDMDGSAKIFNYALDYSDSRSGIYHLVEDIKFLEDIYTLAFADYSRKNNLFKEKEADKFVKSLVDLA
jgi:hypothetical protein